MLPRARARPTDPQAAPPAELLIDWLRRDWPGNVRELRSAVERAAQLAAGPMITLADLAFERGLQASQRVGAGRADAPSPRAGTPGAASGPGGEGGDAADVAIIAEDTGLANRDYQVAAHTDSTPLKGAALQDNWALSVMRARQLLLYMIDEKGGKLAAKHWSAAGFADTDPIASNETDEGKQANRRCEIVLLPTLEETLDLRGIGGAAPKK